MDLDTELDRLYAAAPADFVADRDALVKRLRADGQKDEAAEVKALRRPSAAAWAVNQIALRHPDRLEALFAAGADLARAQRRAMSGIRDNGMREATSRRREVVEALADLASEALSSSGASAGAQRQAISDTFEAASVDAEAAETVRRGRLTRELAATSGFGDVGGFALVPDAGEADDTTVADGNADDDDAERRAVADRARRRREAEKARRRADGAQAEAAEARRASVRAAAEAERLERLAAAATTEAETAAAAAETAVARAEEAAAEAAALERG